VFLSKPDKETNLARV